MERDTAYPRDMVLLGPCGLGGWLVLPIIGLFIAPIWNLVVLVRDVIPAFGSDIWPYLTTPGSEVYHPLWGPLLLFDAYSALSLIGLPVVTLVFLFKRKRAAPKLMIGYMLFLALVNVIDLIAMGVIGAGVFSQQGAEAGVSVLRYMATGVAPAVLWVYYLSVSERVKNTFVT